MKKISIITLFIYMFASFQLLYAWETDIQLSRETSQPKITIGVEDNEFRLDAPPDPPETYCQLKINRYQVSDWESSLSTLIEESGQQSYCFGLSVNPHGNQGPPTPMTALLTWGFSNIPGAFELRQGYDCSGNIVVPDMKTTKEYQVTGQNQILNFTINYTPNEIPVSHIIQASAGNNGNISPSGSHSVADGNDAVFVIDPMTGFNIDDVLVDGLSKGAVNTYTFTNVQANHTIEASFKSSTPELHAISPSSGSINGNETIQLSGKYFSNDLHVFLDDIEINTITVVSDILLTFLLPSHDAGAVSVKLQADNGTWAAESKTFTFIDSSNNGSSDIWEATIYATRDDASPKVIIGVGEKEEYTDMPPDPPEYKVKISIKRYQIEDWINSYQRQIYPLGQDTYCYEIAVNPKGNVGPPIAQTAIVNWDFSHVDGEFSLLDNYGCQGNTIISDMKAITQMEVTGTIEQYFSIIYTPPTEEDTTPPVITLTGNPEITIEQGEVYSDPGATAWDKHDGDLSNQIMVTGNVDTNTPGDYTITYTVSDSSNNVAEASRKVTVKPGKPEIELIGLTQINLERCREYQEPGATALDKTDGDISAHIDISSTISNSIPGHYTVVYTVTNSSGISADPKYRYVTVSDTQKPQLLLQGNNPMSLNAGDMFTDPGATATDPICENDLSNIIVVDTSTLDINTPGEYQVSYTVQDDSGNVSTDSRKVIVLGAGIKIIPSSLHFGQVNITSPKTEKLTVINEGDGDLFIDTISINGQQADFFHIVSDACSGESLTKDQSCEVDVQFAPTCSSDIDHVASIDIKSNDHAIPVYSIPMTGEKGNYYGKPYFTNIAMDLDGAIYDSQLQEIPLNTEVAAFVRDKNEQLMLVGHTLYNEEGYGLMSIYGDDINTDKQEGAVSGDTIIMKVFMAETCTEYTLNLLSGDNIWTPDVTTKIADWQINTVQLIPLRAGWNLISFSINKCFYVGEIPSAPMIQDVVYEQVNSISDILHSIDGQYSYVKGFDGDARTYNLSKWSNMKYMAPGYAYWIRVNDDADFDDNDLIYLKLEGSTVAGNVSVPLRNGWNFVGYLGNTVKYVNEMPQNIDFIEPYIEQKVDHISDIFQTIDGQYSYIRGFDPINGFYPHAPDLSDSKNKLRYVGPGYGYCIKITADSPDSLIWNELSE